MTIFCKIRPISAMRGWVQRLFAQTNKPVEAASRLSLCPYSMDTLNLSIRSYITTVAKGRNRSESVSFSDKYESRACCTLAVSIDRSIVLY